MRILDSVLLDVEAQVAAHPVERGGALLGPRGSDLVTMFVHDDWGVTTGASYSPSRELDARVRDLERREGMSFKGILHSHPGSFDRPSFQDVDEFRVGLDLNPHMASYLAPIVTKDRRALPGDDRVTSLPSGRITWYEARRAQGALPTVRSCHMTTVPLLRDLRAAAAFLGAPAPEIIVTQLANSFLPAGVLSLPGGGELLVIAGGEYPTQRPVLLVSYPGSAPEPVDVTWSLSVRGEERLVAALRQAFLPPGPYRPRFGPPGGPALTDDAAVAASAGWGRIHAAAHDAARDALRDGLFARSEGLLSRSLTGRKVLVVGLGSVGSYMAEQLVRAGVGRVTLVDPEVVEAANLSRTVYDIRDVGVRKTEALARRLLHVNPSLEVEQVPEDLLDLGSDGVDRLVQDCHVVIATTDDPLAQRALSRFSYARGKPAVFVALYPGAQGGEVVVTAPGCTPCFVCSTGARRKPGAVEGDSGALDYGTGRLRGEVALGVDIQHVASAGVKLALSLMLPRGGEARLASFAVDALGRSGSYLTMSTVPDYWFFRRVFEGVPAQGAYQSVWMIPPHRAECPVCGDADFREDPAEMDLRLAGPIPAAALAELSGNTAALVFQEGGETT